jgi:hypothetical protein
MKTIIKKMAKIIWPLENGIICFFDGKCKNYREGISGSTIKKGLYPFK